MISGIKPVVRSLDTWQYMISNFDFTYSSEELTVDGPKRSLCEFNAVFLSSHDSQNHHLRLWWQTVPLTTIQSFIETIILEIQRIWLNK